MMTSNVDERIKTMGHSGKDTGARNQHEQRKFQRMKDGWRCTDILLY